MKGYDRLSPAEQNELEKIFCDGCGMDISYESRLLLTPNRGMLSRDYHFCNLLCLKVWVLTK